MVNILIVEDDRAIREVLHLYLCDADKGLHCEDAHNLPEAIAMVSKKRYDLIFLDLLLEGEMGTPLVEYVERLYPDNTPRICIMSALNGAAKIAEKKRICFLNKPFALESIDEIMAITKN